LLRGWSGGRIVAGEELDARRGSTQHAARAGQNAVNHLRAAQAYMLISMPTGTSTIFGVFQVISVLSK
jgi:hypothetical protein